MPEEEIEKEMKIYGDMFLDQVVRIGVRYICLSVFCLDDSDDVVRFHGTAISTRPLMEKYNWSITSCFS